MAKCEEAEWLQSAFLGSIFRKYPDIIWVLIELAQ